MKQKFKKLSFVHIVVDKKKTPEMSHFNSDFDAIVNGTYSQLHGGYNIDSYDIYMLKNGKIVNELAWHRESQLTLLPNQDRDLAEEMIEEYHLQ